MPSPAPAPTVSITLPTRDAIAAIAPSLEAIGGQVTPEVEVIVAAASADDQAWAQATRAYPWVRFIRCPASTGIGAARAAGLAQARGDIVAFTDQYCRVGPGWVDRLLAEPWGRYAAVGGVVAPAPRRRDADWAIFLNEYAPHVPPQAREEATVLTGNNVAFRRESLERVGLVGEREFWKSFALWRLRAAGERFWVDPDLVVVHQKTTSAAAFLRDRYWSGRGFGASRVEGKPLAVRLARAATCPAVPVVLLAREARSLRRHPMYWRLLLRTLPLSTAFHAAWAAGELVGDLAGPGDAWAHLA